MKVLSIKTSRTLATLRDTLLPKLLTGEVNVSKRLTEEAARLRRCFENPAKRCAG